MEKEANTISLSNLSQNNYKQIHVGEFGTSQYKIYFETTDGNQPISTFHDIPLRVKGSTFRMVVEIPKGTRAKLEINKRLFLNPIKQDIKNGKLREVGTPYPFNYGAFPQTWENPNKTDSETKCKGDNDPLDVVEISDSPKASGSVIQVKVLGAYALIDEGETDWKILCIDVEDPLADKLNDVNDIDKHFPGKLKSVFEFLRDYKTYDGKPQNKFGFDGAAKDKVISECHQEWKQMITNKDPIEDISKDNTTVKDSPFMIGTDTATQQLEELLATPRSQRVESPKKKLVSSDGKKEKVAREVTVVVHVRDVLAINAVEANGTFDKLFRVDVLTVKLDFSVQAFWTDKKLIGRKKKDINWENEWNPELEVYNGLELDEETFIELKDASTGLVKQKSRYVGTVSNWMDLRNFPFERDHVFILIRPRKFSDKEVVLKVPDSWQPKDAIGSTTAVGLMDFDVGLPTISSQIRKRHTSNDNFSAVMMRFPIRRVGNFYIWKVLMVVILIIIMSWSTFSMEAADFADRMSINLTLFLSEVAFLFVVNDTLPKVSYLTFLDKFITGSFVFLFFTAVENYVVYLLSNDYSDIGKLIDTISLAAFPVVYLLFVCILNCSLRRGHSKSPIRSVEFLGQEQIFQGRDEELLMEATSTPKTE